IGGREKVRTLFVSGLPVDIKPRELYLLFRPFKGYEGSLIKLTSRQPVGFVIFDSRAGAEAAKNALNVSRQTGLSLTHRPLGNEDSCSTSCKPSPTPCPPKKGLRDFAAIPGPSPWLHCVKCHYSQGPSNVSSVLSPAWVLLGKSISFFFFFF
uniref:RNA binding protein, mRNA processing factor 2 n=1 Tax=Ursus maritimus TaxID=29073 RepID=A0A452U8X3_URSMA